MHAPDVRPGWQRWMAPRGVPAWAVALSIVWFAIGLTSTIATEVTYGWRAAPIHHVPQLIAWAIFWGWLLFGDRLHRRR